MAYTPTYEQGDLIAIIIDLLAGVFSALVDNVAVIVGLLILAIIVARGRELLSAVFGMLGNFR